MKEPIYKRKQKILKKFLSENRALINQYLILRTMEHYNNILSKEDSPEIDDLIKIKDEKEYEKYKKILNNEMEYSSDEKLLYLSTIPKMLEIIKNSSDFNDFTNEAIKNSITLKACIFTKYFDTHLENKIYDFIEEYIMEADLFIKSKKNKIKKTHIKKTIHSNSFQNSFNRVTGKIPMEKEDYFLRYSKISSNLKFIQREFAQLDEKYRKIGKGLPTIIKKERKVHPKIWKRNIINKEYERLKQLISLKHDLGVKKINEVNNYDDKYYKTKINMLLDEIEENIKNKKETKNHSVRIDDIIYCLIKLIINEHPTLFPKKMYSQGTVLRYIGEGRRIRKEENIPQKSFAETISEAIINTYNKYPELREYL